MIFTRYITYTYLHDKTAMTRHVPILKQILRDRERVVNITIDIIVFDSYLMQYSYLKSVL